MVYYRADLICIGAMIPDVYSLWQSNWSWCGETNVPLSLSSSTIFDIRIWQYYQLLRICRGVKLWTVNIIIHHMLNAHACIMIAL